MFLANKIYNSQLRCQNQIYARLVVIYDDGYAQASELHWIQILLAIIRTRLCYCE